MEVTGHREADAGLRESEERYRRLVEMSPDAILVHTQGRLVFANQAAALLFGAATPEELLGREILELVSRDDRVAAAARISQIYGGEQTAPGLLKMLRLDGRLVEVETRANRIDHRGAPAALVMMRDISERTKKEAEIKRMASFPRLNPFPVLEVDAAGVITFYNQGAVETLEKLGPECSPADFLPEDLEEIQLAARQTQEKLFHRQVRIKDAVFSEAISFAADFDVLRFYAIDITERQRVEDALQVSLRFLEVAHQHTEINPLLAAFVSEVKAYTGCEAVGIRLLDAAGKIPYLAYQGFSRQFYEMESPLSIHVDHCMCINVIKGTTDPRLSFYTPGGSFYMNGTTRFLATVAEEDKGSTRNVCNQVGYESVALIPLRRGDRILGAIHVADHRENQAPLQVVEMLEKAGMQLGTAVNRIQAEEALRESEKHYRSLFDNMLNGFAFCRMLFDGGQPVDFVYLEVNRAFEVLTGLKDVVGKKVSEVIPGLRESDPELFEIYGRVALTGAPERFETYVAALDMWFSISVYSPQKEHFVAVFDVITERKRAEEALRVSEARLRRAEALGHLGHWNLDLREPCRLSGSEEMYRIYGIAPGRDGFTYQDFLQLVYPEDREYAEGIKAKIRRKGQADFGYRIVRPDGELRYVTGMGELVRDEAGAGEAIFGTILDTTELRQKERELQEKNAELERFTYTISHDLKSPLVTIKTFLGYLHQDMAQADAERIDKDLFYLGAAADKMEKLLDELLEMSRIGRIVNPPVAVSFREVVEEALNVVAGSIAARGVKVHVNETEFHLYGDRPRLVEIWQNLVENAVKFMGEEASPRLEVGLEGQGPDTVFFVCDNGMGIDARYHEKIFGLFEKLNPKTEGTGIGLALIKRIVEFYRGTIWLESQGPGQGTCFKFTLPGAIKSNRQGDKS